MAGMGKTDLEENVGESGYIWNRIAAKPGKVPPWGVPDRARPRPAGNGRLCICNRYIILLHLALNISVD